VTGLVDRWRAVCVVCLDLGKICDTVSRKILIEKLMMCRLDEEMVKMAK